MESRWETSTILWHFLLTYSLLTITVSNAFRLHDLQDTVKHIPLTRASPDRGFRFLQGPDFHFDKELHELNNLRLRRSVQGSVRVQNRTKITEEFELTGDNHTVAFLHWAGEKSPVIYIYTCGKVNQTESEDVICEDAYFWRSTDYGSTFKRENHKFKSQAINNVDFCHSNHKKVILSILKPKPTMYISDDEGESFNEVFLNFSPHVISCNRLSDNLIVAHDQHTKKVHYSSDGGKRWSLLANDVLRHAWAPVQVKGKSAGVFLEVQTNLKYTSELKHAKLPCISESNCVQVFDKTLGPFMSNTLEVAGKYVFVQKDLKLKGLYVFYQNSSDPKANTNFFQLARFPLDVEEKSYRVVDASENEMMVVVRHEKDDKSYYNLYVSDVTGVKFALSLENILSSRREVWGQNTMLVDIYRVKGLNGTYLANVYVEDKFGGEPSYKSVITYNKGGEWHPLKPPDLDHNGIPTNCYLPRCSLHIHMTVSHWYYYIPTVMSSTSAVGIIVAQGNLGNGLGEGAIGVFLSNDGGLTWTKEFHSFHDFVIGDHGGILAAVPMRNDTDKVWYSCTEGKVWSNVTLGSKPVYVYGMVTEPGETTLIFNVFGQYASQAFQWLSVKLNFTSVLNQKCLPDNYTYWSPNDERVDGQCLLGQHMVFERRKSGDCCFNGDEYEREINVSACTCEIDDFECDFGYEHGVFGGVCVVTSSAAPIPAICPEGKTYQHTRGYRKVIGDRCKGGVEKKLMPETRPCPIKAPGKLNIKFAAVSKTVEVNKPVNFNLSQKEGSTESTWFAWDFGDGSPVLNITGLSKAEHVQHTYSKHGDFVVQLTAANKAGRSVVTAGIVAKDPITSIDIDPPHAVVIGQEAWFNVTLYSNNLVNPEYGFVHFMWFFEKDDKNKNQKPLLTWDYEVSHTFSTPGVHEVSVTGISVIGQQKSAQVPITVYEDLTTVRLSFDLALDDENDNTKAWRDYFSQRLQASLSQVLDVDTSRLEVVVLRGKPTVSDVSITPAPTNSSKTRKEIVALLKDKVYAGAVKVQLPKETTIRVTRVEVLPGRGFDGNSSPTDSSGSGVGTRLAIGVGIAAGLIVVFLVVTLLYFLRRYNLLRSRYTHLRLYSDGGQLRDPLIEDETEDEQSLHAQPGGSLRYVPVPTSTAPDPDSDEELIENFEGGSLALMPAGQNGQVQEHNVNA